MYENSKLNLFIGNCNEASTGKWISLPMDDEKLEIELNKIAKLYGETIISSYEKIGDYTKSLYINQYEDVKELNNILKQSLEFIALYVYSDEDLEFTKEAIKNRRFLFIPGVENLADLGEAVVSKGLIGYVPKNLIDSGYIDFEQIGQDFNCNGIRLFEGVGAIGQISEANYKKWHKLL